MPLFSLWLASMKRAARMKTWTFVSAASKASLRGLPPGACLYQYTRVMAGFSLPRQKEYADPITESFAGDRIEFLNRTARFRRIDLHWCLTIEPDVSNPLSRKPKEQRGATDRQLFDLEKAATILESHMSDSIGLTASLANSRPFNSSAISSTLRSGPPMSVSALMLVSIGSSSKPRWNGIASICVSDAGTSKCSR